MIDTKKLGILVFIAFSAVRSASAASIPLQWQPVTSPDVRGYRVYYGTASRAYSTSVDVGTATQYTLTGLITCTRYYVAVKAYNQNGVLSSSYSNELVGMPTPTVTLVSPSSAEPGQSLTLTVTGSSFDAGAVLSLPTKMNVISSTRLSCTMLSATISVATDATAGGRAVAVVNPDTSQGILSSGFNVTSTSVPSVRSVSPAPGGSGAVLTVHPSILFSERMMLSSINPTFIRLLKPDGGAVAQALGSPLLDTTGTIAVIIPAVPLSPSTQYRISVLGGSAWGVLDAQGTPLLASYTQNPAFQTAALPSSEANGFAESNPDVFANIEAADDPVVRFHAAMDPASLNADTISLIGPWGPVEQDDASPVVAEDGMAVTIVPRSSLDGGSIYRVRLMGGPLGVREASGRLLPASFETESFVANARPVPGGADASPHGPDDELWPVAIDPVDRTADVPSFVHPSVTFNRLIDPLSLSSYSVRLVDPKNGEVPQAPGSPILEATRTIVTIVPAQTLQPGVSYRIEVAGGVDGVRDIDGKTLYGTYSQAHGFAVEATGVERPDIESTMPADNERRVDTNTRPTVTFTVPLDPSSVDATSIELLTADGQAVAQAEGSPFLDGSGTVVTIVPAELLRGHTIYQIRVVTGPGGIRDLAGRSMSPVASGETRFKTKTRSRSRSDHASSGGGGVPAPPQP